MSKQAAGKNEKVRALGKWPALRHMASLSPDKQTTKIQVQVHRESTGDPPQIGAHDGVQVLQSHHWPPDVGALDGPDGAVSGDQSRLESQRKSPKSQGKGDKRHESATVTGLGLEICTGRTAERQQPPLVWTPRE